MPEIFLPIVTGSAPVQRIAIDPITRIEGHLRIEVQIEDGVVTDAWSAGTMFRGIELILKGRDPREAWLITQRVCGVCTTVHALASVQAVENALGIVIPDNARLIRNLIAGAQYVQDHVIHFYHLHALDWVDILSALQADPAATSALQQSISDWPNQSAAYFASVQARLQALVNSGQPGLFANGYWGHPAYHLPPAANLMAAAHYLEALEWQREVIKIHAILGGKNPHPQTYLVGGVAAPLDPTNANAINPERIAQLRALTTQALDFVNRVYYPDLLAIAPYYAEWAGMGCGIRNFLSYGDFPANTSGNPAALWMPRGIVRAAGGGIVEAVDAGRVREYVTHSWYDYPEGDQAGLPPAQGVTTPAYSGPALPYDLLDVAGKYSWLKAPRYDDQAMEVGPLARVVVAQAAGHARIQQLVSQSLAQLGLGTTALYSTLGRMLARAIETIAIAEQMLVWLDQLEANLNSGNLTIHNGDKWNPSTWPAEAQGYSLSEAPCGALGHWVHIKNGKIENYQMVVPTTWNASPRDATGQRGVYEAALIGTPVADRERPVEVLRSIHSFDPCMACAVH